MTISANIKQGKLYGRRLPFVLSEIARKKLSGMLSLRKESIRKFIFLYCGEVTFVQSSLPSEQLAHIMQRGGAFDDEIYGIIIDRVRENGWQNPELYDSGIIEKSTVEWWLRTMIREVVYSVFLWETGDYSFLEDKTPPITCVTVRLDTRRLIQSSISRTTDAEILVDWLGDLDAIPKVDYSIFQDKENAPDLTPEGAFFISRVDGTMSFRQILSIAGSQRMDMLKFFIKALLDKYITAGEPEEIFKPSARDRLVKDSKESTPDISAQRSDEPLKSSEKTQQKDSITEDVELTDEELAAVSKLGNTMDDLDLDMIYSSGKAKHLTDIPLNSKISYLRDGSFINGDSDSNGAVDVEKMKRDSRRVKKQQNDENDKENKLTFVIDGKEFNAETDLFSDQKGSKIFESDSVEDQWDQWLSISSEDVDEDYVEEWEKVWKDWEENAQEIKKLRKKKEEIENEIGSAFNAAEKKDLQDSLKDTEEFITRLINDKKREIIMAHSHAQIQSYYELLSVPQEASIETIREAYFLWLRRYQPEERFLESYDSIKETLKDLVEKLHTAYDILSDDEQREQYDRQLKRKEVSAKAIQKKKKMLAQDHLASSRQAVQRGDGMLALRFLRGCMSLDPKNPIYFEEMADILSQNKKWQGEALIFYNRAYHLETSNIDVLIKVAKIAKKMARYGFAEKVLTQILLLSPENKKAKRMLADIQMR